MENTTVTTPLDLSTLSMTESLPYNVTNGSSGIVAAKSSNRIIEDHAKFNTVAVVAISMNIAIMVSILASKDLRVKPLFWNILNVCITGLLMGGFVIPFGFDYKLKEKWNHGRALCKVWSVVIMSQLLLTSLSLISLCLDRLLNKLLSVAAISAKVFRLCSLCLPWFPWCFVLIVYIPILIAKEKEVRYIGQSIHCYMHYDKDFWKTAITAFHAFPVAILFLCVAIVFLVYMFKHSGWERLPSANASSEDRNLRMSTIASWVAGALTVCLWIPYIVLLLIMIYCNKISCRLTNYKIVWDLYFVHTTAWALLPVCWLIVNEIRANFVTFFRFLYRCVKSRKLTVHDTGSVYYHNDEGARMH